MFVSDGKKQSNWRNNQKYKGDAGDGCMSSFIF